MVTVSSNQNLEQLRALRPSIIIGDLTERTHRGSLVWNRLPGFVYEAIDEEYDFKLFNNGNQFVLDVFKNGVLRLTMLSSVFPPVKGLYNDVGVFTRLPGENQTRKLLRAVLNETIRVLPEFPCLGGIEVGGSSFSMVGIQSTGGCEIGGESPVQNFYPGHGGCIVEGSANTMGVYNPRSTGGAVVDSPPNIKPFSFTIGGPVPPWPDVWPPVAWLASQGLGHVDATCTVHFNSIPSDFLMMLTVNVRVLDSTGVSIACGADIAIADATILAEGTHSIGPGPGTVTVPLSIIQDWNDAAHWGQGLLVYFGANYSPTPPNWDIVNIISITGTYLSIDG